MATKPKTKKIKVYYPIETNGMLARQFIHTKSSGGLWAAVRDLSINERVHAASINISNTIVFEVNFKKRIVERYRDLIIVFEGRTYKTNGKPDEYVYNKGDSIKIQAEQFIDNNIYDGEDAYDS